MCTLINYTDDREILLEGIKLNGIVERSFKEEKNKIYASSYFFTLYNFLFKIEIKWKAATLLTF